MHKVFYPGEQPEDYDFEEYCPHCDTMIPGIIDHDELERYETVCPVCGAKLMLCTLCHDDYGDNCDWTEEKGCKRGRNEKWVAKQR